MTKSSALAGICSSLRARSARSARVTPLHDGHDGVASILHHAADGAAGFIRAGAFLVKIFTHATDRRERAFDVADDFRQIDAFGSAAQAIAAGHAAFAFDEVGGLEVVENLFQETLRDVLLPRDFLDANDGVIFLKVARQNQQRSERIFPSNGKLHGRQ